MKIKFEDKLDYQQEAIAAITHIFEGQEICRTNFSITPQTTGQANLYQSELGIGNKLSLLEDELLANVQKIQIRNGLKQSKKLDKKDLHFSVEMETGTGKTYVYLRTIFELNKTYGFTKFIIVVPSIAIKEGTNKSLQITKEHFKGLYDNINYDFFTYDSQKLEQVRSFATNDYVQIMVINIDAFRKSFTDPEKETKANIIHRTNDKLNGYKPIDFIKQTCPVVIIDEPQSVDATPKSKEAIRSLHPLCTLRYSATHKDKHHLMYRLDSVDAYERKLVKQIEVASLEVKDYHNLPYIKLLKVDNKKSPITATVEIDINQGGKTKRVTKAVKQNTDLMELTRRSVYEGYIIRDIYCAPGNEYIDFTSQPDIVRLNKAIGTIDEDTYKREQIRKTIEEHLDKELRLNPLGLKVLSLFFIDKVANYRIYDEQGNPQKGKYAIMFEEEYKKLISKPKYHSLFGEIKDKDEAAAYVHDGYFSVDKKNIAKDTKGDTQADEDTYGLIMRDKERLLSFSSKLRFIFSHSTLREGWDNPNVFQICTLNETGSVVKKRQEIGRGLRLAVNQNGERVQGFDVNTLTVMANESYEDFVKALQREMAEEEGINFGVVEDHTFANIITGLDELDQPVYLGLEASEKLYGYLQQQAYIDIKGKVLDDLRHDLRENKVEVPEAYEHVKPQIIKQLKKIAGNLNIKNANDKKKISVNKGVLLSPDFEQLWDRIKYKTTFSVEFDPEKLVQKCIEAMQNQLIVGKGKFIYKKALTEISKGGAHASETHESTSLIDQQVQTLPDIVSYLQNETNLTRKSIVEILVNSGKLDAFKNNPQRFIDEVIDIIRTQMRHFIVDGIKYEKLGEQEVYTQELFQNQELFGHLKHDMLESTKSPYDYVVYDSAIEANMAQHFENSANVKVYAKLPAWFKIDTPLGTYNPDWAVLWDNDGEEKLYFVVETKGALSWEFLRPTEKAKIECGRKHYKALSDDIGFTVAESFESFSDVAMS
ncbi:type III restriction-modification system endonuclease [Pontibacter ramchanderi]|uniref:Type III restriction enzyme n=1 Tax=Pontibacter ramchanderi TaxID=1179743 RepID=A0A2N3V2N2_9BACT|nr:DEAD/DEAH box helicase family protein [Pontibacter ramchanderi]PKV75887.1 type III restriction enzyme [Pontibacter ramchanderi]